MRRAALLAVLLVALVAAGCGGGGGGGGQLSASEFKSKANAICDDVNHSFDELEEPKAIDEIPQFVGKAADVFDDGISRMRELNPPTELQDGFDEFLDLADEQRSLLDDVSDAAKDNDEQRLSELQQKGDALDERSDAAARKIGLDTCAED